MDKRIFWNNIMKSKLVLILLFVCTLYAVDIKINSVYNNDKKLDNKDDIEKICTEYGSCYIYEYLEIFDKKIKLKLPLRNFVVMDDNYSLQPYFSVNKITQTGNNIVLRFSNTSVGTFIDLEIKKSNKKIEIVRMKQVGRSFQEDYAVEIYYKEFKETYVYEILDFLELQNILYKNIPFTCIYSENDNTENIEVKIHNCINERIFIQ